MTLPTENSLEYARMFYFGDALLILFGVTYSIYACREVQKTIDAILGTKSERREMMHTGGREKVMEELRETRRRVSVFGIHTYQNQSCTFLDERLYCFVEKSCR